MDIGHGRNLGDHSLSLNLGLIAASNILDWTKLSRLCSVGFVDSGYGYGSLDGTHRSSDHWYGSVTELTEVPGIVAQACNSQKFRVRYRKVVPAPTGIVAQAYRTHRRSRYGYERHTEHTEVPGTGTEVLQNSQKFRVGMEMLYPYPGYCGTGVQNLQKFIIW